MAGRIMQLWDTTSASIFASSQRQQCSRVQPQHLFLLLRGFFKDLCLPPACIPGVVTAAHQINSMSAMSTPFVLDN